MAEILTIIINSNEQGTGVHWFTSGGLAPGLALEAVRAVERSLVEAMVRAEMDRDRQAGQE